MTASILHVHLLRHGEVESHRGDLPLTERGLRQVEQAGLHICRKLAPGEVVTLLHAPTRRTRETADALYESMRQRLQEQGAAKVDLRGPAENAALRNPDIYVAGTRVELVSSAPALVEQLPPGMLEPHELEQLPFWRGFWDAADRIGFWVNHSNPPGENAACTARRLLMFAASLREVPGERAARALCVTHSPVIRAFLKHYTGGNDPGEPEYAEAVSLTFGGEGLVRITYRTESRTVVLA